MKASVKARRVPRRDLFAELSEGMEAFAQAREGERTLRTHAVEFNPAPQGHARGVEGRVWSGRQAGLACR